MLDVDPTPVLSTSGEYWIGISARHYENLSINMQNILSHIKQKNAIITYYKDCIDASNQTAGERAKATK